MRDIVDDTNLLNHRKFRSLLDDLLKAKAKDVKTVGVLCIGNLARNDDSAAQFYDQLKDLVPFVEKQKEGEMDQIPLTHAALGCLRNLSQLEANRRRIICEFDFLEKLDSQDLLECGVPAILEATVMLLRTLSKVQRGPFDDDPSAFYKHLFDMMPNTHKSLIRIVREYLANKSQIPQQEKIACESARVLCVAFYYYHGSNIWNNANNKNERRLEWTKKVYPESVEDAVKLLEGSGHKVLAGWGEAAKVCYDHTMAGKEGIPDDPRGLFM